MSDMTREQIEAIREGGEGVAGMAQDANSSAISTEMPEGAAGKDRIEAKGVSGASAAPWPEWQPIETAPKDGTVILITNGGWIDRGWWSDSFWLGPQKGWVSEDERECGIVHDDITHWLPLPPPPGEKT